MIDVFKIKEGKLFVVTICGTNRYEDDEDDRVNNILIGVFESDNADNADNVRHFIRENALYFKKSKKFKSLYLPNYSYGDPVIKELKR